MQTILFQGDSITDVGRSWERDDKLGEGYPLLVSASLGLEAPQQYSFLNRGVSGNRVVDLYARIKGDCINLKPDFLSILIGVNDVWHEISRQNGVAAEKYARIYNAFLTEVRAALPDVKIMILEPYVTHGTATDKDWETFRKEVHLRAMAARFVAEKNACTFVPLQAVFDAAEQEAPIAWWTQDGVHPTPFGHALIAREWLRAFRTMQ